MMLTSGCGVSEGEMRLVLGLQEQLQTGVLWRYWKEVSIPLERVIMWFYQAQAASEEESVSFPSLIQSLSHAPYWWSLTGSHLAWCRNVVCSIPAPASQAGYNSMALKWIDSGLMASTGHKSEDRIIKRIEGWEMTSSSS